jgi:hypothetical protein
MKHLMTAALEAGLDPIRPNPEARRTPPRLLADSELEQYVVQ